MLETIKQLPLAAKAAIGTGTLIMLIIGLSFKLGQSDIEIAQKDKTIKELKRANIDAQDIRKMAANLPDSVVNERLCAAGWIRDNKCKLSGVE